MLQTKLYIPPTHPADLVSRPRLLERLDEGLWQDQGFGQMTDDELAAIWMYLQSLPAREEGNR